MDQEVTTQVVYFNENDKYPAQWLRNLFPDSTVDDRSIKDVRPTDTMGG